MKKFFIILLLLISTVGLNKTAFAVDISINDKTSYTFTELNQDYTHQRVFYSWFDRVDRVDIKPYANTTFLTTTEPVTQTLSNLLTRTDNAYIWVVSSNGFEDLNWLAINATGHINWLEYLNLKNNDTLVFEFIELEYNTNTLLYEILGDNPEHFLSGGLFFPRNETGTSQANSLVASVGTATSSSFGSLGPIVAVVGGIILAFVFLRYIIYLINESKTNKNKIK